jgi:hypothetical protein
MKAIEIRQQLHDYIEAVDTKKLKAIYTVMEQDIRSHTDDIWEDEDFINELQRRSASILDGTAKTYTWDEVQGNARKAWAKKKAKNEV